MQVYSVNFSPDGKQIVSGAADKFIILWDAFNGKFIREIGLRTDKVIFTINVQFKLL